MNAAAWRLAAVVFGGAVGLGAGVGPLFAGTVGVFVHPLSQEFGWGRAETALSFGSAMLGVALASPLVGLLMDRYGVRRVALLSALLMAACVASLALQTGSVAAWAALALAIGLLGTGTSPLSYLAIMPQWFDRRLGLSLGLAMSGLGLGMVGMPLLAQKLIGAYGWRMAYVGLAVFALFAALLASVLLRERRAPAAALARRSADARADGAAGWPGTDGLSLAEGLRSPRLWLIFGAFLVASIATLSLGPHLPALFIDRGYTPEQAAKSVSLMGIGLFIGRILTGVLLDRVHAPLVGAAFLFAGASGLLMLAGASDYNTLLLGGAMIGMAIGAEGDLISYLVRSYFGMRAFGALYGICFSAYALGGVIGPVAMGRYFDLNGHYRMVLEIYPWMLGAAGMALLALGRYRQASPLRATA
ncbi:MFS transporter [Pseudoduganella sp. UC29_106]|uniref:MFS transporter n=1 Tax=Pseudoduganella sp. UC29_106 TaxID=3374553 RepID=UPI003756D6F7